MKKLLTVLIAALMPFAVVNAVVIKINVSNDSLQHITGFGAAGITTLMCPIQDTTSVALAYGPDSPIGFNILRVEVSPNTVGDVTSQWYDTPYDWKGSVNAVKCARNRGAIIYACPWSPPAIYKTNNSASGGKDDNDDSKSVQGKLNQKGYENLFSWFKTYAKYMKTQGAPVDIISLQNEPDWWVGYSGCLYSPQELHDLVANYGSKFKNGMGVKLMGGEPLGYRYDYYEKLLNDPESRQYLSYIGGHIYGTGTIDNMKKAAALAAKYGIESWMTEHSVNDIQSQTGRKTAPLWDEQLTFAREVDEVMLAGGNAYVYWYLTQFWSFIGNGDEMDEGTDPKNEILPRGYVMSHFSKHLPGSTRLSTTCNIPSTGALQQTAYVKGDSIVVIAINTSKNTVDLQITLPENVIACKKIMSTSNTDLCKESEVEISEPTKVVTTPSQTKSIITFIFTKENVATAIRDVETEDQQLIRSNEKVIYNLSGQRVNKTEKGKIYVVNGKKVKM